MAKVNLPGISYSCEICGQDDFSDEGMRNHMETVHLKGAVHCPFCDLSSSEVTPNEMTLHVNTAHLEYLTPEREDIAFLEDDCSDFDSIWQLEKGAREGLTNFDDSSPSHDPKNLNCIHSNKPKLVDSPMSTASTEVSTATSEMSTSSPVHGAIQKRYKISHSANNSPSKNSLSLKLRPSYEGGAPLASQEGSSSSSRTASSSNSSSSGSSQKCPLCDHTCKDPALLEEHVNRAHFDPESPNNHNLGEPRSAATPSSLPCPLCTAHYATSLELERHVNRDHSDVLSPMTSSSASAAAKRRPSLRDLVQTTNSTCSSSSSSSSASLKIMENGGRTTTSNGTTESNVCPVCNEGGFKNQNHLAEHIDSHFKKAKIGGERDGHSISSMSSSSSSSSSSCNHNQRHNDYLLAQEIERRERERRKHEEQKEFDQLRAQFGMDNDGNFQSQSISSMQNAVYRGEMSVVDYYERQSELRSAEKEGKDDGRSQTKHLMPKLKTICQSTSQGVAQTYLCSVVDHHSSSFGDKGWGCGYRNLQMLLSSLSHHTPFAERLALQKGMGIASISRLQALIEEAWIKGFDVQGCEQLGGKLVNTRKWIGATEIVAFFTANQIKTELLDFHTPTSKDGTHLKLFQWVLEYFRERARAKAFTPPLYLQHQGHSRTIVGIEVLSCGGHRLLVFDPSHSKSAMASLRKCTIPEEAAQVMRMLRKSPQAIKCKQYQIVAVTGVLSAKEAAQRKAIGSKRIP